MELSQSALALLALSAFPCGILLNVLYRLTDPTDSPQSIIGRLLIHIKDFVFMIAAGVLTVIISYYVNQGDYRYLAPVGTLIGYVLSDLLLRKSIQRIRDWILSFVGRMISVPFHWIWKNTLGHATDKMRVAEQQKSTKKRIEYLMQSASNGFENNTEAKE